MFESPVITVVAKAVVLSLGLIITFLAYRAYQRTKVEALRWMAIGFAIITGGMVFGGLIDPFLGIDLAIGIQIQNVLTAIGFVVLIYSIYSRLSPIAQQ